MIEYSYCASAGVINSLVIVVEMSVDWGNNARGAGIDVAINAAGKLKAKFQALSVYKEQLKNSVIEGLNSSYMLIY